MTTPATKSIKVTPEVHVALKIAAAKRGEHVYELMRGLIRMIPRLDKGKNSNRVKGGK